MDYGWEMAQKNILVPLGPHTKDLTGVHHALALAKRIPARVFILKFEASEGGQTQGIWVEEILRDLVASARQSGVSVSYHTARGSFEKEVIGFVGEEEINLVVLGKEGSEVERLLLETRMRVPKIIQVSEKDAGKSP